MIHHPPNLFGLGGNYDAKRKIEMKPANKHVLYRLSTLDSGRVKGTLISDQHLKLDNQPTTFRVPTVLFGIETVASVLDVSPRAVSVAFTKESVIHDCYIHQLPDLMDESMLKTTIYPAIRKYVLRYRIYNYLGNPINDVLTKEWFTGESMSSLLRKTLGREGTMSDRRYVSAQGQSIFELNGYVVKAITEDVKTALPIDNNSPYQHCARHFGHNPPIAHNVIATPIAYLPTEYNRSLISSVCIKCAIRKDIQEVLSAFASEEDNLKWFVTNKLLPPYNLVNYANGMDLVMREILNPCDMRYSLRQTNYWDSTGRHWAVNSSSLYTNLGVFGSIAEYIIFKIDVSEEKDSATWMEEIEDEINSAVTNTRYLNKASGLVALDWYDTEIRLKVSWYLRFIMMCAN